jgi:DNA helicase-2/ATP-dependent DNA helicase PcrA
MFATESALPSPVAAPTGHRPAPPLTGDDLDDAQRDAVLHRGSPLLIVAGAGTGKTKTLVARLADLIETGVPPERILLLTFTRRAAAEMVHRAGLATDPRAAARVWGGTFHAVGNRLLRRFGDALGLPAGFTVLDQGDGTDLIGLVRSDLGLADRGSRVPRKETMAAIYSRMVNSQAKLPVVLERWYPWCGDHADALRSVFEAYTQRKRRHHVLDYDDLLLYWRALTASAEVGGVLRSQFDHVLVDEYQDTNPIQVDILRALCPPAELTAVGDDAQAIYGFRAATVENMWRFAEHFPGASTVTLERNHRSVQPVLDVANAVLAGSDAHLPKTLRAARGTGARPALVTCRDEAAQSTFVCERILELREQGVALSEQAVLFRAGHHSDALELELVRRDIPFVKFGGLKFLEAAHVKDLVALLRVLENPNDELAWHRVLSLLEGVGPATAKRVLDELWRGDATDPLQRFVTGIGKLPAAAVVEADALRAALSDCIGHTRTDDGTASSLGVSGAPTVGHDADGVAAPGAGGGGGPALDIERLLPWYSPVAKRRYDGAPQRIADLEQLRVAAAAYRTRSRFLAELTLDPPDRTGDLAGEPHLDDEYLVLSTIHSAKGGEWKAVHLIHAADGYLPLDMSLSDKDGLEEERRLLYVALTRARDTLSVTFPQRYHVRRYGHDDRHHLAPLSRFVEPIRSMFDERGGSADEHLDGRLDVHGKVTITDEVDTFLSSLWS